MWLGGGAGMGIAPCGATGGHHGAGGTEESAAGRLWIGSAHVVERATSSFS